MTDATQKSLKELFSNNVLNVPQYQRAYSWETRQVKDLLNDISSLYGSLSDEDVSNSDNFHYFGTIVLRKQGEISVGDEAFTRYDIVDGQQRLVTVSILVSTINRYLSELEDHLPQEKFDPEERPPSRVKDRNKEDYVQYGSERRISPKRINKSTFEELVIINEDSPSSSKATLVSQERMIDAKNTIESWIEERLQECDSKREEFSKITNLLSIINSDLEVTVAEVEDTKEAGRLFEAVNDRGQEINTIDKIRSYLIYCAAQLNDEPLSQYIHSKITSVVENLTQHGNNSDINRFVREYWRMFSGEAYFDKNRYDSVTELHRRLKKYHAKTSRPDEELKSWIKNYLSSLEDTSNSYEEMKNPKLIRERYESDYVSSISANLAAINDFSSNATTDALLLAAYHRLGISEELAVFTDLIETYSFRVYQIAYEDISINRNRFRIISCGLYWAGRSDEFQEIHTEKNTIKGDVYQDITEAYQDVCREIESLVGEYCSNDQLADYLSRDDIEGNDQSQWSGIRKKSATRYLLFEYERYLRENNSRGSVDQLPRFTVWESQGIEIEHIHPQNPDDVTEYTLENENLIQSIGNLALLAPEDNKDAKNSPFSVKAEKVYSDSPMKMLRKISERNTWTADEIKGRRKRIINFAIERWGIDSEARVHISSSGSRNEEFSSRFKTSNVKRSLINKIRSDYAEKQADSYQLPSVVFSEEKPGSWWEEARNCPECGGQKVELISKEDSVQPICVCGRKLDVPSYKTRVNEYSM